MIVLGIDPGTQVTGYGVVRGAGPSAMALVECGVIRTRPDDPLPARLRAIHDGVSELLQRHKPDVLSIEDVFYARNVRTTVTLGHARGVILLAGELAGVRIHEMAPAAIKKAVVGASARPRTRRTMRMTAPVLRQSAAVSTNCRFFSIPAVAPQM